MKEALSVEDTLKLVLNALTYIYTETTADEDELIDQAITAIKEALAQTQEPVAWVYPEGLEALKAGKPWTAYGTRQEPDNTALYLSPQPDIAPYAWVTFTPYGDEDDVWYENPEGQLLEGWTYKPLYDTTPPQPKEPEEDPVAIRYDFDGYGYQYIDSGTGSDWQTRVQGELLYTAPAQIKVGCAECGVNGGNALYCVECAEKFVGNIKG